MNLSSTEALLVGFLAVFTLSTFIKQVRSNDPMDLWSPLAFASLIFFYYTVSGPLLAIKNGGTYFKLVEHRPYFENSWLASLLSYMSLLVGYALTSVPFKMYSSIRIIEYTKEINYGRLGLRLYILGFLLFVVYAGASIVAFINPFSSLGYDDTGYAGSFRNYFILPVNFFIPALCLMLVDVQRKRFPKTLFFLGLFVALSIYLSFAFRYRLIILGMALTATFYLSNKLKPRLILAAGVIVIGIAVMGIIESTRTYFGGLNLEKVEDSTFSEMFLKGFGESKIFGTLGLMIENIPNEVNYIYFSPYYQGFLMPIPRAIWPGKPAGDHIAYVTDLYPNEQGKGAAWPFFGEYYFSFGWIGLIIGSFLLGVILKKFFLWMKYNYSPLIVVTYATGLGCLFFVMTRGYFPQHVMLFFFCLYPCFFILNRVKKSKVNTIVDP